VLSFQNVELLSRFGTVKQLPRADNAILEGNSDVPSGVEAGHLYGSDGVGLLVGSNLRTEQSVSIRDLRDLGDLELELTISFSTSPALESPSFFNHAFTCIVADVNVAVTGPEDEVELALRTEATTSNLFTWFQAEGGFILVFILCRVHGHLALLLLVAVVAEVVARPFTVVNFGQVLDVQESDEPVSVHDHLDEFSHLLFVALLFVVPVELRIGEQDAGHGPEGFVFLLGVESMDLVQGVGCVKFELALAFASAADDDHLITARLLVRDVDDVSNSLHAGCHFADKGDTALTELFAHKLDVANGAICGSNKAFSVNGVHAKSDYGSST